MNKLITLIIALLVIVAACALVAWLPEPCTGGVYADHPGLRAECLHNLAYPGPGDDPYPAPGTATPVGTMDATPHLPIFDLKTPIPTPEPTPTSPPECSKCGW